MTVDELDKVDPPAPSRTATWSTPARWTSRDWARWTFLAYLVAAIPILLWMGDNRWFLGDEWSFLTAKSATDLGGLFAPHNQHWSTIPILIYRLMYTLFGLHEYWPYQLLVILAHLAIAGLLRMVMRRCGVRPWLATVVAGTYVLFGPGRDDILWAFQIGFTLSVVFGLVQMLLADHDGSIDRRDWMGLGFGGLALLTSGQAPSLILATGLAVWYRRGWRQAAFHTVPLGAIYLLWYELAGASLATIEAKTGFRYPTPTISQLVHFVWTAVVSMFSAMGQFLLVDWAYAALLVVGVVVAWRLRNPTTRRRQLAMPVALVIGAAASMAAAAPQRVWVGPDAAASSRYVAISVAMSLPAFAVAADALEPPVDAALPSGAGLVPVACSVGHRGHESAQRPGDQPAVHQGPQGLGGNAALLPGHRQGAGLGRAQHELRRWHPGPHGGLAP